MSKNILQALGKIDVALGGQTNDAINVIQALNQISERASNLKNSMEEINSVDIKILSANEYDSETGLPTIQNPDESTFYLVPSGDEEGNNLFNEYYYNGESWELFGSGGLKLDDLVVVTGTGTGSAMTKNRNTASGQGSFAEGAGTTASGDYSHAEGYNTTASGDYSHAAGANTRASGAESHAEGNLTIASGKNSHASGYYTVASGGGSYTEGNYVDLSTSQQQADYQMKLTGNANTLTYTYDELPFSSDIQTNNQYFIDYNLVTVTALDTENNTITLDKTLNTSNWTNQIVTVIKATVASGINSHAEGINTIASGNFAHAEGAGATASGNFAHAEGAGTNASGNFAHAEGSSATASGQRSHAEGQNTIASGMNSHAEGSSNNFFPTTINNVEYTQAGAYGIASHNEGENTLAIGDYSHAEGGKTTASGNQSHTEGADTIASGGGSHAEGAHTTASGAQSHAEGNSAIASGPYSHAEGSYTTASGLSSHTEGAGTQASGNGSHAEGSSTIANHKSQHVFGEFNIEDPSTATTNNRGNYVEIVGNGSSASARSNARTLDWSGNESLQGSLTLGKGTANETTITAAQLKSLLALLNT